MFYGPVSKILALKRTGRDLKAVENKWGGRGGQEEEESPNQNLAGETGTFQTEGVRDGWRGY